jgi:imidazolonepropionase-like amidohydrolase
MGFGTDLLGETHDQQSREFRIRSEVLSPLEILRSATLVNARILRREGELGVIAPDARADLLVVDGNPLEDLSLLEEQGKHLRVVAKGGELFVNDLD